MKKSIIIIILLGLSILMVIKPVNAMDIVEQEAWIGAYFYKELNPIEKYYPYIDIRALNVGIYQPDYVCRSIVTSYIIPQPFQIIQNVYNKVYDKNITKADLINEINNKYSSLTAEDLSRYILEVKALLLMKAEIDNCYNYLQIMLGLDLYNIFKYKFNHIQHITYQTAVPFKDYPFTDTNYNFDEFTLLKYGLNKDNTIIKNLKKNFKYGTYTTYLLPSQGELQGSIIGLERINEMIPLKPSFLRNVNSPLVSHLIIPIDQNLSAVYATIPFDMKYEWKEAISVYQYEFNKNQLDEIISFYSTFDNTVLEQLKMFYLLKTKKAFIDDTNYDNNNIHTLLRDVLKPQ